MTHPEDAMSRIAGTLLAALVGRFLWAGTSRASDAQLRERVKLSIERAQQYLVSQQLPGGSWSNRAGAHALVLLSLATSGSAVRSSGHSSMGSSTSVSSSEPGETYDTALMIMAYAAVDNGKADRGRMANSPSDLRICRICAGFPGSWGLRSRRRAVNVRFDNSNTQYAILGMREAAHTGSYEFDRATWRRARDHWLRVQEGNRDSVGGAGWGYSAGDGRSPAA